MDRLSHLDEQGSASMVDVGSKSPTSRRAIAEASLSFDDDTLAVLRDGNCPKGNVYETARLAGIMAAKRTADLIPLCHPLPIDHVSIQFNLAGHRLVIQSVCKVEGKTGVEMEALTAASVAALTVYDMLKSVSHAMVIENIRLLEKSGGKSGVWHAPEGKNRS